MSGTATEGDKGPILIVEDDEAIQLLVDYNLLKAGFRTLCAASGAEAVRIAKAELPRLIILDIMLPDLDGREVCRRLRADPVTEGIPVIMLTALAEEADVVAGFDVGADDYMTKPFSTRVLVARVESLLRRHQNSGEEGGEAIVVGDLVIDPGRHELVAGGKTIGDLTATEFRILCYLARRPGHVRSRYQIVDAVHGGGCAVTDRSVDVQIAGLRKKLGPLADVIETVRNVGYRLRDPARRPPRRPAPAAARGRDVPERSPGQKRSSRKRRSSSS